MRQKIEVSIVGIVGLPACYGGFETLVENIVLGNNERLDITVYCSAKHYSSKLDKYNGVKLVYLPIDANGGQSILYDIVSLIHVLIKRPNTVLILGVSGCLFLPFFRFFSSVRVITNIDGMEWKRAKWGYWTKKFLKFSEKMAVKYSDVVISDNQAIADYLKSEYDLTSSVIAYGGDHAVKGSIRFVDENYAFALCRIEPENNVEMILEAFSQTNKILKFVGNWNASDYGRNLKKVYGNSNNLELIDPIYDLHTLFELRRKCSFYVHGHSAGGTNPSLVEMMHIGKNMMLYDCVYNRATTNNEGVFFNCVEDIVENIPKMDNAGNGLKLKEIAELQYTWEVIREQYYEFFVSAR